MDASRIKQYSNYLYWTLVLLALAYLVALCVFPVGSNDVFFYLEIGRRYFAREGIPTTDIFRFTGPHAPLEVYHELGAMLLYYLAYAAGGFNGVILLKCLLFLAIGALPFWVAWKLDRERPSFVLPVLSLVASYGASLRFIERGSLVSDLLTTLLVSLIILIRARVGGFERYRLVIPAIFLVWVNSHAGFVIGFLLLLLWLAAEFLGCLLAGGAGSLKRELSPVVGVIAASAALGLVNPRGPGAYTALAGVVLDQAGWALGKSRNPEFMSPFAKGFVEYLDIRIFIGVMLAGLLLTGALAVRQIAKRDWRGLPVFEVLAMGALAYFGFSMTRFIVTATFGALAISAAMFARSGPPLQRGASTLRPSHLVFPALATLAAAGCLFSVAAFGYGPEDGRRAPGLGLSTAGKPVRACEFIERNNVRANIFNKYEYGAYMIWRWQGRRGVFVHGFSADAPFLARDYEGVNRSPGDFDRVVGTYAIGAFLVSAVDTRSGLGSLPYLYQRLLTDRQWRLVYADQVAMLFLKDVPENRAIIGRSRTSSPGRGVY